MSHETLKSFATGFCIAMLFGAVHHGLGLAMAAIVGKAAEDYDLADPEKRMSGGHDAYATVCGAVPAQVIHAMAAMFWPLPAS